MEPKRLKKDPKNTVKLCAQCKKHVHRGKWVKTEDLDEAIYDLIEQRFKSAKKVELYVPDHKPNAGVFFDSEALIDNQIVPIKVEYTVCRNCSKMVGQAFNGVLQLRNPTKEIEDFVKKTLDKVALKGIFCTKESRQKNGIDYRLTDGGYTRRIGKLLQDTFGGELNVTARLITRDKQTQKDLYRVTAMFRVPKYKKGDILNYKGNDVKVLNMTNKVYVQNLKTKKKEQIPYEKLK